HGGAGGLAQGPARRRDERATLAALNAAAWAGDAQALGALYEHWAARDAAKAVDAARRGALLGNPELMVAYAVALENRMGGSEPEPGLAAALVRRAADEGNASGLAVLEVGRVTGQFGIRPDPDAGRTALRALAAGGSREARFYLARLIQGGRIPAEQ